MTIPVSYGSPPRARGEAALCGIQRTHPGITPACAGRRRYIICPVGTLEDHPRVCGEKFHSASLIADFWGSPPRVRGEGGHIGDLLGQDRITPACAGRSDGAIHFHGLCKDHPRVCGEKKIYHLSDWNLGGSPPRVRGEDCLHLCGGWAPRITPACAGRSSPSTRYIRATRDHPRVCGEKKERAGHI